MSTVYEALDGGGSAVALKLLHPSIAADPHARDRLRREVRTLRHVTGAYVAQVIDAETEDEEAFIVTELIDGPTLSVDVCDNGVFVGKDLADLAKELAGALQAIHGNGVLHRDLKPSNVMMSQRGPVLIDFGIAQIAEESRLTATGLLAHTPGYAAPEVLNGEDPTTAADWWSWGATLAYAATGHAPFGTGHSPKVTRKVLTGECDLSGADPVVAYALEAALNPRPDRRPDPATIIGMLDGSIEVAEDDLALGPRHTERLSPDHTVGTKPAASIDQTALQGPPGPAPQYPPPHAYPQPFTAPPTVPPQESMRPVESGTFPYQGRIAPSPYDTSGTAVFHARQDSAVVAQARFDPRYSRAPVPIPDWLRPAPRRPGLVLMLWGVFVAWAGVLPSYSIAVFVAYSLITSIVGVARGGLIRARLERGGRYRTESITILSRLPLSIIGGTIRSVSSAGFGLVIGSGTAWFMYAALEIDVIICVAVGALVGSFTAWIYPTSRASRETTRHLFATIAPSAGYRLFWGVLGVALLSLALALYSGGAEPDWSPFSAPFLFN